MTLLYMYDVIIARRIKIPNFKLKTLLEAAIITTQRLLHVLQRTELSHS